MRDLILVQVAVVIGQAPGVPVQQVRVLVRVALKAVRAALPPAGPRHRPQGHHSLVEGYGVALGKELGLVVCKKIARTVVRLLSKRGRAYREGLWSTLAARPGGTSSRRPACAPV